MVGLITEWINAEGKIELRDAASDLGGTMRLGGQVCHHAGSKAREAYGADEIVERHRHRFEVNNQFIDELEAAGLVISARASISRWSKSSSWRITLGTWRVSSTRSSPRRLATVIRSSRASSMPH